MLVEPKLDRNYFKFVERGLCFKYKKELRVSPAIRTVILLILTAILRKVSLICGGNAEVCLIWMLSCSHLWLQLFLFLLGAWTLGYFILGALQSLLPLDHQRPLSLLLYPDIPLHHSL